MGSGSRGLGSRRGGWWRAKVGREGMPVPSSTGRTKAVRDGRLVGTVSAFVLRDICYTSPAASWRLRLTACGNNARLSDPLSSLRGPFGPTRRPGAPAARRPEGASGDETSAQRPAGSLLGGREERGPGQGEGEGEGRAAVKKQHAGAGAPTGGVLGFDPFPPPGSRRASGPACLLPPVRSFLRGHPRRRLPVHLACAPGPSCLRAARQAPGCQAVSFWMVLL